PLFRQRSATEACVPGNGGCEALGTTYPHPQGWQQEREPMLRLPAPRRLGPSSAGEGQPRGSAASVLTKDRPKVLTGLDQKVCGQARVLRTHPAQTTSHRRRGGT